MAVAKIKCRNDLPKESPRFLWLQTSLLDQIIEELSARDMLQYEVPNWLEESLL